MQNSFNQRKVAILSKLDKSSIGEWDEKIISLCEKLNKSENYYTTSSCAGRIALMIEQDKKAKNLFLKVWHNKISFKELKNSLIEIKIKKLIKFKFEPAILHLACKDLNFASEFLEKAKHLGWKRSGILTYKKNIILELNSTEKLEFPILNNEKILVDDLFLKLIIELSNKKFEKTWEKIDKLKESI